MPDGVGLSEVSRARAKGCRPEPAGASKKPPSSAPEQFQRGVQQGLRAFQPGRVAQPAGQPGEPQCQRAIILGHAVGVADHPVQAGPAQTAVQPMRPGRGCRPLRQSQPVRLAEHLGRADQGIDREPVPGGDQLAVPGGREPLRPDGPEPLEHLVQPLPVGRPAQLQRGKAVLEGAGRRHVEQLGRPVRVGLIECVGQQFGRPDVVDPLVHHAADVAGVGIETGGESAAVQLQVVAQEGDDAPHRPFEQHPQTLVVFGGPAPAAGVAAEQQGVVVQHLLEVRHHPAGVDAVPVEAAADLVVDAAAQPSPPGCAGRCPARRVRRSPAARRSARGAGNFGRPAEPAVNRVEIGVDPRHHRGEVEPVGDGRAPNSGATWATMLSALVTHLVAAAPPGFGQGGHQLAERRHAAARLRWVIGAGEERPRRRGSGTPSSASRPGRSAPGWPSCTPRRRPDAPRGRP